MKTCSRAAATAALCVAFCIAPPLAAHAGQAVPFQNGGIGDESRQEMAAARHQYRLRMSFAETRSGAYITGVSVVIERGQNGGQLRFEDCGPLFYVAMEPGVYHVTATYGGLSQSRVVDVRHGARELVLYWPAASES
ncbi:hypothetical protein [Rhodoferax koreensis]|nr:hypothetical protein [Rhodoferax koreense]